MWPIGNCRCRCRLLCSWFLLFISRSCFFALTAVFLKMGEPQKPASTLKMWENSPRSVLSVDLNSVYLLQIRFDDTLTSTTVTDYREQLGLLTRFWSNKYKMQNPPIISFMSNSKYTEKHLWLECRSLTAMTFYLEDVADMTLRIFYFQQSKIGKLTSASQTLLQIQIRSTVIFCGLYKHGQLSEKYHVNIQIFFFFF